jgi:DNA invertase Pin-like site-specific DNA recombinase
MKVALYLRVSTKDQTTLNQELKLQEYCQREGHEIFAIYRDNGVSGSKVSRPALDKMLQDMRQKKFEGVITWKYDRLGRSVLHCLQVLEEMKNKGVRFIATSQNIDSGTAIGKFFLVNLLAVGEMERELIRERVNLGLDRARTQGKALGRPKGSKDKGRRPVSGYHIGWLKRRSAKQWDNSMENILENIPENALVGV